MLFLILSIIIVDGLLQNCSYRLPFLRLQEHSPIFAATLRIAQAHISKSVREKRGDHG
jgi:hypothetical protein